MHLAFAKSSLAFRDRKQDYNPIRQGFGSFIPGYDFMLVLQNYGYFS